MTSQNNAVLRFVKLTENAQTPTTGLQGLQVSTYIVRVTVPAR